MASTTPTLGLSSASPTVAKEHATFTLFPKFPAEIRLRIWDYASFHKRDIEIFTVPMGVINFGTSSQDERTFSSFRWVSSHPVPAIIHTSKEARQVGLKHYQRHFGVEVCYMSFDFSTADRIYYNPASDRICFLGPVVYDAVDEITDYISLFANRVTINLQVIESEEDGDIGLNLCYDLESWFHGTMDEIALYSSHKRINKGDRFHFVDFDMGKINTKRGKFLTKAKKRIEKQTAAIVRCEKKHRADQRAGVIQKCEEEGNPVPEPCACQKVELRQPIIKLVSLVMESERSDN